MCNLAAWGDWYTIGILVGLGASIGVAATGALGVRLPGSSSQSSPRSQSGSSSASGTRRPAGRPAPFAARSGRRRSCAARCAAGAHAAAPRHCSRSPRSRASRSHSFPCSGTSRPSQYPPSAHASAPVRRSATPGSVRLPRTSEARPKPVVLVIVDGLTPSVLEAADTPALRFLAAHGEYRRAVSTFPSLTPVCLARSRRAHIPTGTTSRTSSGGIAVSSVSSSTARRSRRSAPPGSRARCATRLST